MPNHKRIVLNTFGSFGDIHPYMALAIELQARGHEPVIATSPLYREKIELAGLSFAPIRPDMAPPKEQAQELIEKIMEPKTGPRFLLEELIFPFLRESYEDLVETVSGADALVTHPAAPAGPPPALGEHSRVILREAGYQDTEIDELIRDGACGGPPAA